MPRGELSEEAFRQMALALGIEPDRGHLDILYPIVQGLWRQLGQLDAVAMEDLEPETVFRLGKE